MIEFLSICLQVIFWLSLLAIAHSYAVFPLVISKLKPKSSTYERFDVQDENWPELHVVMAMYNEGAVIQQTLESIVESDYPVEKLTIHVGSDNSTDDSHDIVEALQAQHPNIQLTIFESRSGKIKIINSLVDSIPNDEQSVLLLCDANVTWSKEAARNLARHFKDQRIGIVACNVLDSQKSTQGIAAQEDAYVNRENLIKYNEGQLWGRMMGAFGACYALRRSCYREVPTHYNVDDFFETLACYEQGYDGIVDLKAICYEAVSTDINEEFRRKQRISKGNFQNFKHFGRYLQPWNCGLATWFAFWSHKGLRWFGPLLLLAMTVSSVALASMGYWLYIIAAVGIIGSFAAAGFDQLLERFQVGFRFKLFRFIRYFYSMNFALLLGAIEFVKGVQNSVWEPTKRVAPKPSLKA